MKIYFLFCCQTICKGTLMELLIKFTAPKNTRRNAHNHLKQLSLTENIKESKARILLWNGKIQKSQCQKNERDPLVVSFAALSLLKLKKCSHHYMLRNLEKMYQKLSKDLIFWVYPLYSIKFSSNRSNKSRKRFDDTGNF